MGGRTTKFQTPYGVFSFQFIITEAEISLSWGAGWGAAQDNSAGGWTASPSRWDGQWGHCSLHAGPPCAWEPLWAQNPVCRDFRMSNKYAWLLFIYPFIMSRAVEGHNQKGFECWGQVMCFSHLGLLDRLWEQSLGLMTAGWRKCPWVQDEGNYYLHSGVYWRKMSCACRSWHYRDKW